MITITNKHIGWGMIFLIMISPWIFGADDPISLFKCMIRDEALSSGVDIWGLCHVIILFACVIIGVIGYLVHIFCRLFDPYHTHAIQFRWQIRLIPTRRKRIRISSDTKYTDLLIEFGQTPEDSPRHNEIFNQLKRAGVWDRE